MQSKRPAHIPRLVAIIEFPDRPTCSLLATTVVRCRRACRATPPPEVFRLFVAEGTVAWGAGELVARWPGWKRHFWAGAAALVGGWTALSFVQTSYWKHLVQMLIK